MEENGNGRAGIREVYAIVTRLEDKFDEALAEMRADIKESAKRISRLERWRAYLAGGAAVIVLGLGVLVRVVVK